jgi:DNA-directed RNA polymerase subunit RPC12/RpoP
MLMNCWGGLQHARALLQFSKLPRRDGFACPACKTAPPVGDYWKCGKCGNAFDTFQTHATCPSCSTLDQTRCSTAAGSINERLDGWLSRGIRF